MNFLNSEKHLFYSKSDCAPHQLPREVVKSSSLEILNSHLDMVLGSWI